MFSLSAFPSCSDQSSGFDQYQGISAVVTDIRGVCLRFLRHDLLIMASSLKCSGTAGRVSATEDKKRVMVHAGSGFLVSERMIFLLLRKPHLYNLLFNGKEPPQG
ncbi:hypothetical protein S912_24350 [Salmonella enterica subsp. enterica]|nr:hypothetical protein [Salmonella enterica subsp. enterica]